MYLTNCLVSFGFPAVRLSIWCETLRQRTLHFIQQVKKQATSKKKEYRMSKRNFFLFNFKLNWSKLK